MARNLPDVSLAQLRHGQPAPVMRIMVRMPNWIGDAVMATPALASIREAFPAVHIAVVANPLVAALFTFHPCCDRVIVFDKRGRHQGAGGFWRFCCELRRERFDLAILLQNAFEAAFMAALAGIPRRAGYRTDGRRLLLRKEGAAIDGINRKGLLVGLPEPVFQAFRLMPGDCVLSPSSTQSPGIRR